MTNKENDNLQEWLVQRELEASRQSRRQDNKEPMHVLEARAIAFEDASIYHADILQKAKDLTNDEYTTEAQEKDLQQLLKQAIMLADDIFNTSDPYYVERREYLIARSEALSEVLEFINSGQNQGQQ